MFNRQLLISCIIVTFIAFTPLLGAAADFPKKDITMIVPWGAGGGTDTISRTLVKNAKKYLGVNINVVNKTGGMGAIGMGATANSRPDGYTVGTITFQLSTYQLMGLSKLTYKDFNLIQMINQSPAAITVAANSKWQSMQQLMDYAKKNPGLVTVGHSGAGGSWHLAIASLATANGVKFNYVPFDGSAPNRAALIGGHVDVATSGIDEMLQLYKAGKVRILAVNALKRHISFPNVPTIAEAGFPNSAPVMDWRGIATAKGVAPERMQVLEKGFKAMFNDPEFKKLARELALPLSYKNTNKFNGFLAGMENSLKPALKNVGLLKQ